MHNFWDTEVKMRSPILFPTDASKFLVCGLGSLGQYCVAALKAFGASVSGIDLLPPTYRSAQPKNPEKV